MLQTIATEGQSLMDVCLQEYGTLEAIVGFAKANAFALNREFVAGTILNVAPALPEVKAVVDYLKLRGIKINTGRINAQAALPDGVYLINKNGSFISASKNFKYLKIG